MQKTGDLPTFQAVNNPPATTHGADRILKDTLGTSKASASTNGAESQESGQKKKKGRASRVATGKHLNITCEDLWKLQIILDGKKVSIQGSDGCERQGLGFKP